jgi:TetR/AcrR family transcriptional regulator, transcriptional repressor for nem operon
MTDQRHTKEQILDIAENILRDRGYNGFSYKDISNSLGIRNASVHYHYPTKTDLGVAIIRRAMNRFEDWAQSLENRNLGYSEKLNELCLRFKMFVDCQQQICLGGTLQTDFKTIPEEMQKETRQFVSSMLRWLENLLEEGRELGVFDFSGKARDQALLTAASLQGAVQLVRATEPSSFDSIMNQIKLLVCR